VITGGSGWHSAASGNQQSAIAAPEGESLFVREGFWWMRIFVKYLLGFRGTVAEQILHPRVGTLAAIRKMGLRGFRM